MQRSFVNIEKTLQFSYGLIILFSFLKDTYSQPYTSLHVNRSVFLLGFHRILQYNVSLPDGKGPTQILIVETLPKDVYLDPYQLSKRIEDNEIKIMTDRPINSEIPAYQAQPFDIQLCSVSQTNTHEIELPIHLRYQKPHDCKIYGDSVVINLGDAIIHVRTHSEGTKCFNIKKDESWMEKKVELKTSFHVPVGCSEDLYIVFGLTISVVLAGALYISYILIRLNKKL